MMVKQTDPLKDHPLAKAKADPNAEIIAGAIAAGIAAARKVAEEHISRGEDK
jgi:hypothetical protein